MSKDGLRFLHSHSHSLQSSAVDFPITSYESWVVPAGVGSALADILGAEFSQIIDFVLERGGGFM